MDLPDCPPGAEGYQDSVIEKAKKPEDTCTKAEQEFQEHLNSLKIKLEDDTTVCMVERRGRDISGKWIYLCYPCAAVCSGESVLQTHISGKKHKSKLAMRSVWPKSILENHPYIMSEKGNHPSKGSGNTEKVLQKMAQEVDLHNRNPTELDLKYNKYREVRCHIQDIAEGIKAPVLGLEYLVEHPPEQSHYEPSYICVLCSKQGHPRTIVNHMTCFWHRYNYLIRHFPKASCLLGPYRTQAKYREGVSVIMNRLAQRIEDKYGRLKPVNIDKEEYEKDKEQIHQWIFKGYHFSEQLGQTFEEVVDVDLITSLHKSNEETKIKLDGRSKDPSPPFVAAPSKPRNIRERRGSDALSDISDEAPRRPHPRDDRHYRERPDVRRSRFSPYADRRRGESPPFRSRYSLKNPPTDSRGKPSDKEKKPANYEYKVKLAEEKSKAAEESARKTLAYHEKNPEKHPLYPEEWKKFWNRRYKEIQAEGKDPSKHDFKPEWIVFWTTRMKELHDEELRINVTEIYRKLCLTPPDMSRRSSESKRKSPERRRPVEVHRSEDARRDDRRRSPERRRSNERRRSMERRRSPAYRRERRSPEYRRHSPVPRLRTRSRSPIPHRSPARTHISLESMQRRSRSPLSRRGEALRNRSPHAPTKPPAASVHGTVMISDDELKPDDGLSPWNSDNDIESLGSLPDARSPVRARSRTESVVSSRTSRSRVVPRDYHGRAAEPQDLGPPENIVATLRLLVALEDYLGSLGPKVVDLLTEALKMEKESANSSEELLERESALVLMETAKEKLKGAALAGLLPPGAAAAARAAVLRAATTLHAADNRARKKQATASSKPAASAGRAAAVPVAGVGAVDRAQIAQQMAAALIAQGKTDVSSDELAQLVDAVVGMAEAKKREAEVKQKVEARAIANKASRPVPAQISGTASALQMLQSAYDENDKKVEKEDAPDAMDGLSDSDLETLLKNFNELSAEEQHSLIAYLKKLEAREPQRVEKLRQYVSAAATCAPPQEEPAPPPKDDLKPVTIESDDDDYTVEEVFQSATQKVKEDQIRQEMEIVKKSLEESKPTPPPQSESPGVPSIDLTKQLSSATDLLALVQASIQSAAPAPPADVVPSASQPQPRSFGDLPEPSAPAEPIKSLMSAPAINNMLNQQQNMPLHQQNQNMQQNMFQNNMQQPNMNQQNMHQQNMPPQNMFQQNMPPQNMNQNMTDYNMQQDNYGNQGYGPQPNQTNFGGNRNFQNNSYNQPPPWDQRDNIMNQNNMMQHRDNNMMHQNQGPLMRPPGFDNRGPDSFNQGPPRGNFMNDRKQDNYDTRPQMNQQFNNQGKNFRGRGRGGRGRGRGFY